MEKMFCILGKSSAGKDTLVSLTSEEMQVPVAVSFTTRPKREGELEGKEYHFITDKEFKTLKQSGRIAESTSYAVADNQVQCYGLTRKELEKGVYVIAIVNPDGLRQLTEKYGDKIVSILIECDGLKRLKRSIERDKTGNPKEICRRYLRDEKDFEEIICDYIIYNDKTLEEGLEELKNIISEEINQKES